MSSRKILILAFALPTLGLTVYSFKHSGKTCGGIHANEKEYLCPRLYECVLESNKPNANGVCRFLPNGIRLWRQKPQGNVIIDNPPVKDPTVAYDAQTKKAQKLTLAHNKFGFELLKNLVYSDESNSKNVVISPTSLGFAFNIIYNGAVGPTKDQMTGTLHLSGFSLSQLNESAKLLLDRLNAPASGITSNISNSLWIRNGTLLNESIIREAQANYNAYITNLDFAQPESPGIINNWVSGNTSGKITNIVPDRIDPLTVSYIINTAYFNGIWKYKFDPEKIADRDFYLQSGATAPVKSMVMERDDFLYLENETFQAVKLTYGPDQKYSMVVLLPKDLGIDDLLAKFDMETWQGWLDALTVQKGTLYLPKYKLEYEKSLKDTLKSIGMVLPFDEVNADFSKLSADGTSKDFYISSVLHKTYIDVNEEGTEAAAATVIEVGTTTVEKDGVVVPPFIMDVNKPFFFAITNHETQANIFVGVVREL